MTEHDRGAYTPQPDTPLQFDARGPRRRKPMPMTLIGSGAVLLVLLGALALHYRRDAKVAAEPPPAPVAAAKAPAQPALPATTPAKDEAPVDVFGGATHTTAAAKPPVFTPGPEAPKPRGQLTVQTEEASAGHIVPLATTSAAAHPSAVTPSHAAATVAPASVAPASVAKAAPVPAPPVKTPTATPAPTALAKAPAYHAPPSATAAPATRPDASAVVARLAEGPAPKRVATAEAAAPESAAAVAKGTAGVFAGSVVQIGAFSSMSQSEKGWTDVSSAMAGAMSGKMKRVEAVEKDGKTYYRTSVTGFPSRAAAEAFCRSLTAKGHACFAKG